MQRVKNSMMRLLALMLAIIMTVSYAPEVKAATSENKVKNVTVSNLLGNSLTLKKGASRKLKVRVTVSGTNVSEQVTYASSKPKVATVNKKGKITAKKKGTAKITIASKEDPTKKAVVTVKVGTPAKSVKLNTTAAEIVPGETTTLKATVGPKTASNKKVVWKTSNKKIATVSGKGVVKGVAAGETVITAEAADGSGKKATAKITVHNKVGVEAVTVLNESVVQVKLTDAQPLAISNFAVKVKSSARGTYRKTCKVDAVETTDNKTYLIVLDEAGVIGNQNNVQVTVTGLWGTKSASKENYYDEGVFKYADSVIYKSTYGQNVKETLDISGVGYMAYTVSGLPQGIIMEQSSSGVVFSGTSKQKGTIESVLTATDEMGNVYTYSIIWLIGGSDTIAAAAGTEYYILDASGSANVAATVEANGGSGMYSYSLTGDNYGLSIAADGSISGRLSAIGTYTLNVNVTDTENPSYKTTTKAVIGVTASVTISGMVKNSSGNPLTNVKLIFKNRDKASNYTVRTDVYTDKNGIFSCSIQPGSYDVEIIYGDNHKFLCSQELKATRSGYDIILPVK